MRNSCTKGNIDRGQRVLAETDIFSRHMAKSYCLYIFVLMWENFRNAFNETRGVGISWLGQGNMGVWKTRIGNSE